VIIIVEDDIEISTMIQSLLRSSNLESTVFNNGKDALDFIKSDLAKKTKLFILDRMLPYLNGIEISAFIRSNNSTLKTPILMVTALSSPEQIIEGLDAGADDYITKPFDFSIFMARIRSLLRRSEANENNLIKYEQLEIDTSQCIVSISGIPIELTLSEFKLLCYLFQTKGKVFTRNQLVSFIQDGPINVTGRTIDTHIFGLRKKLGEYSNIIETIRGIGYRIKTIK
jgi:DNA-binding response OmpR family regulator